MAHIQSDHVVKGAVEAQGGSTREDEGAWGVNWLPTLFELPPLTTLKLMALLQHLLWATNFACFL